MLSTLGNIFLRAVAATVVCAIPVAAAAQTFPTRPITMVVPFPPGGSADVLARTLAQSLGERVGQPVVVENRPGAGTAIGTSAVARSAPDGYTVLLGTVSSHAINPGMNPKIGYDPIKDFAPITPVASIPFALLAHPSFPAKNVQELIAIAKQRPGEVTYASAGAGTSNHLAGELFSSLTGIRMNHVPYKGSAPALNDLLGGQVNVMFDLQLTAAPHVKSGAARPLAITSAQRSALLPDVPTVAESGIPGYDVSAWFGIFAPAGTPGSVVERLNAELGNVMRSADVQKRFAALGAEGQHGSVADFEKFVRSELEKWTKVVKDAGVSVN